MNRRSKKERHKWRNKEIKEGRMKENKITADTCDYNVCRVSRLNPPFTG